jgi:hypothetical protein
MNAQRYWSVLSAVILCLAGPGLAEAALGSLKTTSSVTYTHDLDDDGIIEAPDIQVIDTALSYGYGGFFLPETTISSGGVESTAKAGLGYSQNPFLGTALIQPGTTISQSDPDNESASQSALTMDYDLRWDVTYPRYGPPILSNFSVPFLAIVGADGQATVDVEVNWGKQNDATFTPMRSSFTKTMTFGPGTTLTSIQATPAAFSPYYISDSDDYRIYGHIKFGAKNATDPSHIFPSVAAPTVSYNMEVGEPQGQYYQVDVPNLSVSPGDDISGNNTTDWNWYSNYINNNTINNTTGDNNIENQGEVFAAADINVSDNPPVLTQSNHTEGSIIVRDLSPLPHFPPGQNFSPATASGVTSVTGVQGQALNFGTDGELRATAPIAESFTAIIYGKSNNETWSQSGSTLINAMGPEGFSIEPVPGSTQIVAKISNGGSGDPTIIGPATVQDITNFHQYAVTYDNLDQIATLYIDGERFGSSTHDDRRESGYIDLLMGTRLDGALDEFMLLPHTLDPLVIKGLFEVSQTDPDSFLHLHLDPYFGALPEPSSAILLGICLVGIATARRHRY